MSEPTDPKCALCGAEIAYYDGWHCLTEGCGETLDDDKDLEREISNMLMACADWFGRNPQIKADPRAWQHLAVYWPNK